MRRRSLATILHIITGLNTGGAERSLHSLLSGGLAVRHQCHVVCLKDMGDFGAKIEALGVPVYLLGMTHRRASPLALLRLGRIVREIRPDLIQGWMYHGNLAASTARVMAIGRPFLSWNIRQSLDNIANDKPSTRAAIRAVRMLSGQPDCILYNSYVSRAQHEAFGYHSAHGGVIPNGFDTSIWRPDPLARQRMRATLGLRPNDKLVGFVGRYHPMKDIPNFLHAMAGLMAANPQVHCAIIGQDAGPENPALTPYFNALPEGRFHVFGRRNDVAQLMPGLDLLCLSSRWGEAFPNVVGEAMACGVPCVATDVGDCRHVIGNTGRIVPASDPVALREALCEVLLLGEDARLSLGAKARARIDEHFSLSATVDKYTFLYNSILKGR